MGLYNNSNVECIKDRTRYCGCPSCRLMRKVEPERPKVKLSRRERGLILSVLNNYVIECDNRSEKKSIDSPEWLALQRLARDIEDVVTKIREAERGG